MKLVPTILLTGLLVVAAGPSWTATPTQPGVHGAVETALGSVAKHLSPPYALYLFESLNRQILSNERLMEKLDSPLSPMSADSLWALDIISRSILIENQDGQYLDVRLVPPFFTDIAERYFSASHYWPDRDITPESRREHLAAWYAAYLMLLVANETQDEIARVLQNGVFDRPPEGLQGGGPPLVDRLHREKALSDEEYPLVHIQKRGPALEFPAYMDKWKANISKAYGLN